MANRHLEGASNAGWSAGGRCSSCRRSCAARAPPGSADRARTSPQRPARVTVQTPAQAKPDDPYAAMGQSIRQRRNPHRHRPRAPRRRRRPWPRGIRPDRQHPHRSDLVAALAPSARNARPIPPGLERITLVLGQAGRAAFRRGDGIRGIPRRGLPASTGSSGPCSTAARSASCPSAPSCCSWWSTSRSSVRSTNGS